MAEITLGKKSEIKTLKVNIGEKTYSVPLAGSLTFAEVNKLRDDTDGISFFEKYIPKKVLENLTVDDFRVLNETWKKESGFEADVPVGE